MVLLGGRFSLGNNSVGPNLSIVWTYRSRTSCILAKPREASLQLHTHLFLRAEIVEGQLPRLTVDSQSTDNTLLIQLNELILET